MSPDDGATGHDLLERFRAWLRDRHLPATQQRDMIATIVLTSREHLSVDGIQRRLREEGVSVGLATIYRALDTLVESGLVRANDFGEGFRRFEPMHAGAQHGHLVCTRCGQVTEFSTDRFERLLPSVSDEHGFQHHRHRVEIHGLCRNCRAEDVGAFASAGRSQ
jgi:Fur family ferric uptake transcriptional regulator